MDDSGMPGMNRVDSLAEYLVELRNQPSLALTNQQVRNIYCLATFPLCPVIHVHTFFCLLMCCYVLFLLR